MQTRLIKYDRIPRKYHLFWNEAQKAIIIQIHRDCLRFIKPIPKDSPWVLAMSERHSIDGLFDSFSGDLSGDSFGFNNAIVKLSESDEYIEFIVPIPRVRIETVFACQECGVSGRRQQPFGHEDEDCLYCGGSGREIVHDWRSAFIVTSSLSLLFLMLDVNEETSAKGQQHIAVTMMADYGQHGSSLGGCFSCDLMGYFCSKPFELEGILENAEQAMRTVHARIFDLDDYDSMSIRVESTNGSIGLTCPGDACGINTSFDSHRIGQGSEFSCHNVDSPLQSLTLLAGIASMIGQAGFYISARERIKTPS